MGSKCFLSQVMLYTTGTNNLPWEPGEGKSSRDKGSCLSVSSGGLNPITGFVLDSDQAIRLALPLGKFEYGPLSWQGSWEIEKTVNKGVVKTLSKQKQQGREERTWWKAGKKRNKIKDESPRNRKPCVLHDSSVFHKGLLKLLMLLHLTSITWGNLKECNNNVKRHEQNKNKSPHYFTRVRKQVCITENARQCVETKAAGRPAEKDVAQKDQGWLWL